MSRLILTFEDIAAGALKGAGLADRVVPFGWRFVWGTLPSPSELKKEACIDGLGLIEFCERFDAVELWADPEPNAQLQLVWLLDHLRPHENAVSRLALVHTDTRIGSYQPEEWITRRPPHCADPQRSSGNCQRRMGGVARADASRVVRSADTGFEC